MGSEWRRNRRRHPWPTPARKPPAAAAPEQPRNAAPAINSSRPGADCGTQRGVHISAPPCLDEAQFCSALMPSMSAKDNTSMTTAMAVAPAVVILLQFGDDQQRRDFGFHRHVAGDENDRAVFADRTRESEGEAGEQRGPQRRQDRRGQKPALPRRPSVAAACSTSCRVPREPAATCAPRKANR